MPVVQINLDGVPEDRLVIHINGVTYTPNVTPGITYPGSGGDQTVDWDTDVLFEIDANDDRVQEFR